MNPAALTADKAKADALFAASNADLGAQEAALGTRQNAVNATHQANATGRDAELKPAEDATKALIDQPGPERSKTPGMPEFKPHELVDPKQYEQLSYALLGMALIGGVASHGNWLGVSSSLNGALKGFMEGNQQQAEKEYKDYNEQFKSAKAKEDQANKEFEGALNNRKLSINEQIQQVKLLSSKWDRQDMRAAAEQKTIDGMWTQLQARKQSLVKTEAAHTDVTVRIDGRMERAGGGAGGAGAGGEASQVDVGQVLAGMPLSQVMPGYSGKTIAAREQMKKDAAKTLMQQNPGMTEQEAGAELARRTTDFLAGKSTVAQLTKQGSTIENAVGQLDFNATKAAEEMKKLPSAPIPVLNAIARGAEKWSGDPAYTTLFFYMNAALMESAKITSGGTGSIQQLHEGAAKVAREMADVGVTTPQQWNGLVKAMKSEGAERMRLQDAAIAKARGHPAVGGGAAAKPHPQDSEAVQWAKAHSGDPRAAQILKANGQ